MIKLLHNPKSPTLLEEEPWPVSREKCLQRATQHRALAQGVGFSGFVLEGQSEVDFLEELRDVTEYFAQSGLGAERGAADVHLREIIESIVAPMRKEIADLRAAIKEPTAPKLGRFDKWLMSEDAKEHAGKHVAWLPGAGVIEIAQTADALMDKLEGNPRGEEVSIAIVPTWQAVKA